MIRKLSKILLFVSFAMVLRGCMAKADYIDPSEGGQYGAPRLVVSGKVTNTNGEPLRGINVAIYGVREATERDVLSYNYAITDTLGNYTIIRYRGRPLVDEVTVEATDSRGVYKSQTLFAPVEYDSIKVEYRPDRYEYYNGFVTADFVLEEQ